MSVEPNSVPAHRWLEVFRAAADDVAATVEACDPADTATPVAACPGWTVRDLVVHMGQIHQWAGHVVHTGGPRGAPQLTPADGEPLAAWYRSQAEALQQTLALSGPDATCWTLTGDGTAVFWQRRQAHEALMHLWDLRTALGVAASYEPPLAWDGLAEVRDVFYPRQVSLGRTEPLSAQLQLTATDHDGDPILLGQAGLEPGEPVPIQPVPDEPVPNRPVPDRPVRVTASAETLLLLVWHRLPWSETYGDPRAEELLAQPLTP